jgi:tetratricopeptide (TPR) repeat protein
MPMQIRPRLIPLSLALLTSGSALAANHQSPPVMDFEPTSFAGSYLAGRSADAARDLPSAATFYAKALESDANNPFLIERVLLLHLATGRIADALTLAGQLIVHDPESPVARLALGAEAIERGAYLLAIETLNLTAPSPLSSLTAGLMEAWAMFGTGDIDAALSIVDELSGPTWYAIFKNYHSALLLDAAGRSEEAVKAISEAYDTDGSALRIVDSYARIMARGGHRQRAINAVVEFAGEQPLHPAMAALLDSLRAGLTPEPIASEATTGAAEVLYGLGTAIGGDDGPELPAAYLRLALHLDPHAALPAMAMGDLYQSVDRCGDAIRIYDRIPVSAPLRRNADIQIGNCLESLQQPEKAAAQLQKVVEAYPADFEAAIELGNIYRSDNKFREAAEAYSIGIETLPQGAGGAWRVYYFRGISYERSGLWPQAEADFRHALKLNPDQPHVLNYLGYSWIDMGENLGPALDMIQSAVNQRPDDGYIVDSLGWAYYRTRRFEEAVSELERAVELRPEDPVINDHLGDAMWKNGRKREALFQWAHARDLEPEEGNLAVILEKLQNGLPADDETTPSILVVAEGESLWTIAARIYGDGRHFQRLIDANGDKIGDGNLIFPGMKLSVPPLDSN